MEINNRARELFSIMHPTYDYKLADKDVYKRLARHVEALILEGKIEELKIQNKKWLGHDIDLLGRIYELQAELEKVRESNE